MKNDKNSLNKVAVSLLTKIKVTKNDVIPNNFYLLIDKLVGKLENGNSNATYEQCELLFSVLDEKRLTGEKAEAKLKVSHVTFLSKYSKHIKRYKHVGLFSNLDTTLIHYKNQSKHDEKKCT